MTESNNEVVGEKREGEPSYESDPSVVPRIYVASLGDYNSGRLVGRWLDASISVDEISEGIQAMLAASPSPGAEEWAIHDYEGFGPLRLDEYESMETVSKVAQGISAHGPAFAHWAVLVDAHDAEALERFEDAYLGHFENLEDYAEGLLDDLGYLEITESSVPDFSRPYMKLDVEGFARDLELSGDVTVSAGDGGVYIFEGHP